jgi:phosphodiesterase/alkaline phosphatase D-like protein
MRAHCCRFIRLAVIVALLSISLGVFAQQDSPLVWGPNLGAISDDSIAITWNTSRPVSVDLHYATANFYDSTANWEETLYFEAHEDVAEIWLDGLLPATKYRYQLVLYEGDAIYECPIGYFTTSSPETRSFSFLVYGDTRTNQDLNKLVSDTMARDNLDAALVINTGDLVESPTIGRFKDFFSAIGDLALCHPYLCVIGNHEKASPRYYEFCPLPTGGGKADEQWWSFDYGNVHFVGIDTNTFKGADAISLMREQIEWVKSDLEFSKATFKVVFFHHPIYSSTWDAGVNEPLQQMWEQIFVDNGVDVVFNGHMHCYEHFYMKGIHHVVTGGGGAPLQEPVENIAPGTVFRRYRVLHYLRVTVSDNMMRVEAIPVGSVYDDQVHLTPGTQAMDSFTIYKP